MPFNLGSIESSIPPMQYFHACGYNASKANDSFGVEIELAICPKTLVKFPISKSLASS